jgi:hypothetical protein
VADGRYPLRAACPTRRDNSPSSRDIRSSINGDSSGWAVATGAGTVLGQGPQGRVERSGWRGVLHRRTCPPMAPARRSPVLGAIQRERLVDGLKSNVQHDGYCADQDANRTGRLALVTDVGALTNNWATDPAVLERVLTRLRQWGHGEEIPHVSQRTASAGCQQPDHPVFGVSCRRTSSADPPIDITMPRSPDRSPVACPPPLSRRPVGPRTTPTSESGS